MDLADYADETGRRSKPRVDDWMAAHPEIAEQVVASRTDSMPPTWITISRWIEAEHGIKFDRTSLRVWCERAFS